MAKIKMTPFDISRRYVIKGGVAMAATSLLPGCNSSSLLRPTPNTDPSPDPRPKAHTVFPQPTSGTERNANLSVSYPGTTWPITIQNVGSVGTSYTGCNTPTIPAQFMGLSLGKGTLYSYLWRNSTLTTGMGPFLTSLSTAQSTSGGGAPGPILLRIAGSDGDHLTWGDTGTGNESGWVYTGDVDALYNFLVSASDGGTPYQVIYGLNLAGVFTNPPTVLPNTNPPANSPSWASTIAEAEYVYGKLGSTYLYAFEIGNEPDLYPEQIGQVVTYGTQSYTLYENMPQGTTSGHYPAYWGVQGGGACWDGFRNAWNTVYSAITAVLHDAVFIGPAGGADWEYWTIPYAETTDGPEGKIALLTQHYYRGDGTNGYSSNTPPVYTGQDAYTFLTSYPDVSTVEAGYGLMNAAGGSAIGLNNQQAWRMDEGNSYFNPSPDGDADGYGAALWAIDHMYTLATFGSNGMNFMTDNGSDATGAYPNPLTPPTGYPNDVGGYSPLAINTANSKGSQIVEVRPIFYGLMLINMMGMGKLLPTVFNVHGYIPPWPTYNMTAYAVLSSSNNMRIIINNKDASNYLNLLITIPQSVGFGTMKDASCYTLTGGSSMQDTTGVAINGVSSGVTTPCTISASGVWSPCAPNAATQWSLSCTPNASGGGGTVNVWVPTMTAVLVHISMQGDG